MSPPLDTVYLLATPELDITVRTWVTAKGEQGRSFAIMVDMEQKLRAAMGQHSGIRGVGWVCVRDEGGALSIRETEP